MNKILTLTMTLGMFVLLVSGVLATTQSFLEIEKPRFTKKIGVDSSKPEFTLGSKHFTISEEIVKPKKFVKVELSPSKKRTTDGELSYKVSVTDTHPVLAILCAQDTKCLSPEHKYKLSFRSRNNIKGSFDESQFSLKSGETKTFELKVKSDEIGEHWFIVKAKGNGYSGSARGAFIYEEGSSDTQESYFRGKGVALNTLNSKRANVHLSVIKEGDELNGKMDFAGKSYKVEGFALSERTNKFFFTIYDGETDEPVGYFNGNKGGRFIRGNLAFTHEDWSISDWTLVAFAAS